MNNFFSSNLKYLREKNKMSQEDLAKLLGVELAAISHWENKRREPKMDIVLQIAKIFNVDEKIIFRDLRIEHPNEEIKEVEFGDMKITLSKDGNTTNDDLDEAMAFILEQKMKNKKENKN